MICLRRIKLRDSPCPEEAWHEREFLAGRSADGATKAVVAEVEGKRLVDDPRVLTGVFYIKGNSLQYRDGPFVCGPPKTL